MEIDTSEESDFPLTSKQTDDLWREGLKRGNRIRFTVASGSMYPTFVQGDSVLVKQFPPFSDPRLGDIVLFYIGETWVVHRIVGKELRNGQLSYWQKGDAEYQATLMPASALAGNVVSIEHDNECINLDTRRQKIINRSIGIILFAIDWMRRSGVEIGKGKSDNTGWASAWRVRLSACLRKTKAVLVRIGARLMRLGTRH